jgi:mycofactocin precursor
MTVTTEDSTAATDAPEGPAPGAAVTPDGGPERLVEEDLLVEDVSIDGMCGVY